MGKENAVNRVLVFTTSVNKNANGADRKVFWNFGDGFEFYTSFKGI